MKSTCLLVESLFFAAKVRLLAGLEGGAAFGATTHFGEETGTRLGHVFLPRHGSGGWSDGRMPGNVHLILVDAFDFHLGCWMIFSGFYQDFLWEGHKGLSQK